jgi:hypothetical protein
MSDVGLQRANQFAVKKEVAAGTYIAPASGADFIPLRPGNELNFEAEQLDSDELLNDIGASKSFTGKESTSGSHSAYLKHSGVEGQEPECGVMYESVFGTKNIIATERDTVAASTTAIVKVDTGEGAEFPVGTALLVKNGSGYEIRNVASVLADDLTVNFLLNNAPGTSVNLGKAVTYIPAASGHPTFSTSKYIGGGFAKQLSAGNTTTELSVTTDANAFGEVEFSYEGTKYYYNPLIIGATNKFIDFTDDTGTYAISVAQKIYKTPIELAQALQDAFDAATVETITVSYSNTTGKFTIATATSAVLSLLWQSGTNAANSIGTTIGFLVAANDTGAVTYTSDNAQTYAAPYTPAYDNADAIIIKGAELFIGTQSENACICAQSVSITISKEIEDVDCICEETGVKEKIPTGRTVEMTVTALVKKYDVAMLDALLTNKTVAAMLNAGPKVGGNWVAGKCFNAYMANATVSGYSITGDSFVQAEITLKGFIGTNSKDIYFNFI